MEKFPEQPVSIPEDVILPELARAEAREKELTDAGYEPLMPGGRKEYIRAGWTSTPDQPITDLLAQIVPDWRNENHTGTDTYKPKSQVRIMRGDIEIKRFDEGTTEYERAVAHIRGKLTSVVPGETDYHEAA